MVNVHWPPMASEDGINVEPSEHKIGPTLKPGEMLYEPMNTSGAFPTFETVRFCEDGAVLLNPRLESEKAAAGPAKLINGVAVTWSFTVIGSVIVGIVTVADGGPVTTDVVAVPFS